MSYDALARELGEQDALGYRTTREYDVNGRTTRELDAMGGSRGYFYDSLNRVTTVSNAVNSVLRYGYDARGKGAGTRYAKSKVGLRPSSWTLRPPAS